MHTNTKKTQRMGGVGGRRSKSTHPLKGVGWVGGLECRAPFSVCFKELLRIGLGLQRYLRLWLLP